MAKKLSVREAYIASLQSDESLQALDVGTGWDFSAPCRNRKALVVVEALQGVKCGYRLDYKNLACKRFQKWAAGAAWFKAGDMLSPADVKAAVREFYRRVATGELSWSDGCLRMLQLNRLIDGTTYLEVVPFVPGLYRDTSSDVPQATQDTTGEAETTVASPVEAVPTASEEVDVLASVEAMLASRISLGERAVLERALHDLKILARRSA